MAILRTCPNMTLAVERDVKTPTLTFIWHKINTNPLMHLCPRRESPGTGLGRHPKSARQGITKVGGMPA